MCRPMPRVIALPAQMPNDDQAPVSVGEHARALVHVNVKDVIFYLRVEGDHFRFVEINPAFTQATGLTMDQIVGKLVEQVIPEPSLSLVLSKYREAIREGRTVRWEEVSDYPSGRKYGEVSVTPLLDAHKRCTTLVGTVHDITESRRARALKAAEQEVLELVAFGANLQETLTRLVLAMEEQAPPAIASVLLLSADGKHVLH